MERERERDRVGGNRETEEHVHFVCVCVSLPHISLYPPSLFVSSFDYDIFLLLYHSLSPLLIDSRLDRMYEGERERKKMNFMAGRWEKEYERERERETQSERRCCLSFFSESVIFSSSS